MVEVSEIGKGAEVDLIIGGITEEDVETCSADSELEISERVKR